MSILDQAVENYLQTRRALGFKLVRHGRLLPALARFVDQAAAPTLTTDLALAWAILPADHPQECAYRLSVARGFARYLQSLDANTEVPPTDLLPRSRRRASPYLYSDADVVALMAATSTLRFPFRSATYCTLIGLLAVTGMRIGEAIALDRDDLDWTPQRLTIREAKFGASRELPLHPSTMEALANYAQLCDQRWPRTKTPFFLSLAGTRLHYENVHWTFGRLVRTAGLHFQSSSRRPRIHDLRHTFAVNTVVEWYRSGVDVAACLPQLSTYLGHAAPAWTYWYLSATPELLALAAARLDQDLR